MIDDVKLVTMVLAGGKGERLSPLTQRRSKPAVPFGGSFRIIDFTLMNCVMSGIRRVHVLTQYYSLSLSSHIQERWAFLCGEFGEFIETVPPKLRTPTRFYRGTADAVFHNLDILEAHRPDVVLVLSGDHIYRADYAKFIRRHLESHADVTVLRGEVDAAHASSFGVMRADPVGWVQEFVEKPKDSTPFARAGQCSINLGVYCFSTRFLVERLVRDAKKPSAHDFGRNILPESLTKGRVLACPFSDICPDPQPYWRDVGDIDSYFQCHQDLLEEPASFPLLEARLPEGSRLRDLVPAKVTTGGRIEKGWSLICVGAQIGDAHIVRSVLAPQVEIAARATVDRCILFKGVRVGAGAKVRNAIIDENVVIPPGTRIGYGNDTNRFRVSPNGVVVVTQGYEFPEPLEDEAGEAAPALRHDRLEPSRNEDSVAAV